MLITSDLLKLLGTRYIYIDNDFLGHLFTRESLFTEFINFFKDNYILISDLTRFEFLRDTFLPKQMSLKDMFLKQDFFYPAVSHNDLHKMRLTNALILSKIYAHNNRGKGVSYVDLMLAAELMHRYKTCVLITGNKKDFPSSIFTILGCITCEEYSNENPRTFYVIEFNIDCFNRKFEELKELEIKYEHELLNL